MAAPVGQQVGQIPNQRDPEPLSGQAPAAGGLGNAPTTLQSARPAVEKGYIETGVQAIINFLSWLFSKIFFCFAKTEPPPTVPLPGDHPPLAPQQRPPEPPRLSAELQADIDLMNAFKRLPADTQKRIHIRIGADTRAWWKWGDLTTRSNEELGMNKIFENPQILSKYISI